MRVEEAMTRDVITATPSTSLKEAATLFLKHRISGLPVVDDDRVVGVLSESDIVAKETSGYSNGELSRGAAAHLRHERAAATVAQAMTPDPVTVESWVPIWSAADLMAVHEINRLPVLDVRGVLVGIVTRDDLVRAFARSDAAIERDIREHLLPMVELSPNALEVTVARGVVTVHGEIDHVDAGECLRRTIHLVPGVVQVAWQVEVPAGVASRRG